MRAPLLRMEGISKRFPGVLANDRIDFEVQQGEIRALLGENGSGKTTLMNALYGIYRPDSGRILFRGREVSFRSPRDAIEMGIGMVHQHFMLVPPLTVTQNIVLGLRSPPGRRNFLLDLKAAESRIEKLAADYGLDVDLKARVWQLPVGAQQRVEILKALYREAELLILDEPTAVLTPGEVGELIRILRNLADSGRSIIFITHKLNEVKAVADRVTVLRGGRRIEDVDVAESTPAQLAEMMVGRQVAPPRRESARTGKTILSVNDLHVRDDRKLPSVKGIRFSLAEGEILGIAGVDGNGQKELVEAIAGVRPIERGEVSVAGIPVSGRDRFRSIGHVTEDRHHTGLVLPFTVAENLALKTCGRPPLGSWMRLNPAAIRESAEASMRKFDVRAPGTNVLASTLSGGNQQKLILARELGLRPPLLLAAQPTRGLDVGAAEYVQQQLIEARDQGMAILLVSTELDEIMALSDRIMVLYEGEIMGLVDSEETSREEVGLMMAGTPLQEAKVRGE